MLFFIKTREDVSFNHSDDICFMIIPPTAITAPIIIAVQAAAVVPLFQYNPPIITAPEPPAKMAAVIAKNNAIFWFCWNNRLKKKIKIATPKIEILKTYKCVSLSKGLFQNGIITSWIKILPHECK